jgi:hypothetical protein
LDSCAKTLAQAQPREITNAERQCRQDNFPQDAGLSGDIGEHQRATAITARLNRLTFDDADEIRARQKLDESLLLNPPFYAAGGDEIVSGVTSSSIRTVLCMTWAASISQTM